MLYLGGLILIIAFACIGDLIFDSRDDGRL